MSPRGPWVPRSDEPPDPEGDPHARHPHHPEPHPVHHRPPDPPGRLARCRVGAEADHREVEKLCKQFERTGDGAHKTKRKLVDRMITEHVRRHVKEEEGELFPILRQHLGRKRLVELGGLLTEAKRGAPTRPHPRSPDTPPSTLLPNAVAGAVDKARDLVGSMTSR